MADVVNHPPHYKAHPSGVECIELTEHMDFCVGNAFKYLWRYRDKGRPAEDLSKALWYIEREFGIKTGLPIPPAPEDVWVKLHKVLSHEDNQLVQTAMLHLATVGMGDRFAPVSHLGEAHAAINELRTRLEMGE